MKWDCGRRRRERNERRLKRYKASKQWHHWFAWHPVKIKTEDCRWLEYVERRWNIMVGEYSGLILFEGWQYRAIKKP